jgi:transcriptional regulator with XRE-family HTH domain
MSWKQELGEQIKKARKSIEMTQQELADQVDVSRQMICRYEAGEDAPAVEVLAAISLLLEAQFQVRGCRVAFERTDARFMPRVVTKQFELPFDKPRRFRRAVVEITPRSGRILIKADIPA